MRQVSGLARLRGTGVLVFTFAALVLFAMPASAAGAVYKGLAIATTATGPQLYATDFHNARLDVFNATWAAVTPTGGFVDPKIPAGYAPFGIQTIGARIFVTFAKQGPGAKDEIDGQGLGFVDAFDT